jgi:hypothetical protein
MKKQTKKRPGVEPQTLVIDADWKDAIKRSLVKKLPVEGLPKRTKPKGKFDLD